MSRAIRPESMGDDALALELDALEAMEKAGELGTVASRRLRRVRTEFERRHSDAM